jgi:hypothetical protein
MPCCRLSRCKKYLCSSVDVEMSSYLLQDSFTGSCPLCPQIFFFVKRLKMSQPISLPRRSCSCGSLLSAFAKFSLSVFCCIFSHLVSLIVLEYSYFDSILPCDFPLKNKKLRFLFHSKNGPHPRFEIVPFPIPLLAPPY